MAQNMLLAVVLIFLVMASLFESALYPLSIITSIVFAIVGSIWFLTLTGTTITMMAMIGFMVLMGVVVNIGIVLIAHVIDLRHAGMPRHQAILQAGRDRLRPIMMTTLTTLLGMLPLAIGDAQVGGGGEGPAYYPLARAVMGGLAFSAVVSLIIVPMFYVWFDDLNLWRQRVFSRARGAPRLSQPQPEPGLEPGRPGSRLRPPDLLDFKGQCAGGEGLAGRPGRSSQGNTRRCLGTCPTGAICACTAARSLPMPVRRYCVCAAISRSGCQRSPGAGVLQRDRTRPALAEQ